jgi:hypothetical protein
MTSKSYDQKSYDKIYQGSFVSQSGNRWFENLCQNLSINGCKELGVDVKKFEKKPLDYNFYPDKSLDTKGFSIHIYELTPDELKTLRYILSITRSKYTNKDTMIYCINREMDKGDLTLKEWKKKYDE